MASYDQVVEGLRTALQQGNQPMAERFKQIIENREYEHETKPVDAAITGALQGSTAQYGDEITSAVRATLEKYTDPLMYAVTEKYGPKNEGVEMPSFGELYRQRQAERYGGDWNERYQKALQEHRDFLATTEREHPKTAIAGQMAGGLAGLGKVAGAGQTGKTFAQQLPRTLGTGALFGGLSASGMSESDILGAVLEGDEERVKAELDTFDKDIAEGALWGAALSPILPGGVALTKKVLKRFVGKDKRVLEEARRRVQEAIQRDLDTGEITLEQAKKELASTPGMTPADVALNIKQMAIDMAGTSSTGGRIVRQEAKKREKKMWNLLSPQMAKAMGSHGELHKTQDKLLADMKARGDFLYGEAESIPIRATSRLLKILKNREFNTALKNANKLRAAKEKPPIKEVRPGQMMATDEWDSIVQGMDMTISGHFTKPAGVPKVGHALKTLREEFREELYKANPMYRTARETWAGDALNMDAFKKGLNIFKDDPAITRKLIKEMSPSELANYKIATMYAYADKIKRKAAGGDLVKSVFSSPRNKEIALAAFGSKKNFKDFMNYTDRYLKMYELNKKVLGATAAKRVMEEGGRDLADATANMVFLSTGEIGTAGMARRGLMKFFPQQGKMDFEDLVGAQQAKFLMGLQPRNADPFSDIMAPVQGLMTPGLPALGPQLSGAAAASGLLGPEALQQ